MHVVAAVATDNIAPFELAVACEVFGLDRPELGVPWYEFIVCAADPPPLRTSAGFTIDTPYGMADLARADTIIIPAWHGFRQREFPEPLLATLRTAHDRGARMMSVCTGAFLLAAAGLLDGRRATTHWMYAEELAASYPDIKVDPNVLYVDEGQVLTSAGTAAGIDLCLHVVRMDYGADIANAVARRMVVPPHRDGGQAQYVDHPIPISTDHAALEETMRWALEHLDEPLTVPELARRATMSPRTFARRFAATTGSSPHQWLLHQRLLLAQRLLESTDVGVEHLASRCGFGSAATLRHHFQRVFQTSPTTYRRTFRAAG